MPKPLLTYCYVTYRPGGIDLLAMGMAPQRPYYELVVVDDFAGRVERGQALRHLKSRGVNVTYYGPGLKRNKEYPLGLGNAMNTGAIHCNTSRIVYVHDFTYLPVDATESWITSFDDNGTKCLISGIAQMRSAAPPKQSGDISIWEGGNPLKNIHPHGKPEMWIPEKLENFYLGVPMRYFADTNGIDERADGHITWPLECMMAQAYYHGYRLVVDRGLAIGMPNHREWITPGDSLWHAIKNEKAGGFEPGWTRWSDNSYSLLEERSKILGDKK